MAGSANITISGYVAVNPEIKEVGGSTVANFSIPVSHKVKDQEITTWFRCAVWGKRAEIIAKYVEKGSFLIVNGSLSARTYEGGKGPGFSLEVNVNDFSFGPKTTTGAKAATTDEAPF
jgi:single-strand DNA-binding protein